MPTLKRVPDAKSADDEGNPENGRANREHNDDRFAQPTNCGKCVHESLSISSAINSHRTKEAKPTSSILSNHNNNESSSDILAVVLSTSIQNHHQVNVSSKTKTNRKTRVRILISDASLPSGQCARVNTYISQGNLSSSLASLLGLTGASSGNELGALQPGDVIRLNRMEVRNCVTMETDSSPLTKRQKLEVDTAVDCVDKIELSPCANLESGSSLLKVTCDLYPSWKDLTVGPHLARLCRINPKRLVEEPNNASDQKFSLDWESDIPPCMETPKELVTELGKWYCTQTKLSTAVLSSTAPCQRRKLRDITMQNIMSHVVVKVLRCDKAIPSPRFNRGKVSTSEPRITHATLSDGPDAEDIIGIGGSMHSKQVGGDSYFIPKSISTILLQSLTEGSYILLTRMLSRTTTRDTISMGGKEALMIIPTQDTIATIITPDHPFYIKHPPRNENPFASQLTLERPSQLYSMSQQHSPSQRVDSKLRGGCHGVMAVVSPLLDIIVDGIFASFREGRYWQTDQSLSKFLIDTPIISTTFKSIKLSPTYRSATILLDPKIFSKEMVVNADADALKLLCMEVPPGDMVVDLQDRSNHPHPYLPYVGAMLKALTEEKTPIRWILEQESESSWFITSASLIEI